MKSYNWGEFIIRIPIHSTTEKIYQSFATQQGMESWFLRLSEYSKADSTKYNPEEFVEPGSNYNWMWHGWPDSIAESGKILKANGQDIFSFTFTGNAENDMAVEIIVTKEKGLQIVNLRQYNIPQDDFGKSNFHLGCSKGWTFYLTNLKSILEGGLDLRNKDLELKSMINC
ncbi:MAG: SRPBCC domain-containing protein [Saprospiraceae bacterium]